MPQLCCRSEFFQGGRKRRAARADASSLRVRRPREHAAVDAPISGLLERISDLDEERIVVIARTLGQASVFNEVVRDQVQAMEIGERYRQIAEAFNSIRDDSKTMVDQLADAKIDFMERITNVWMKLSRGDISDRFDDIKRVYLDVTRSTKDQVDREHIILDA